MRSECVIPSPAVIQFTSPGLIIWFEPSESRCWKLPWKQVGDRRPPDVRALPHVDALAGHELHRPHLVEENEWPDHLALRRGQRPAHLEPAEVARPPPRSEPGSRQDVAVGPLVGSLDSNLTAVCGRS